MKLESGFYATESAELLAVFGGKIGISSASYEEDGDVVYEMSLRELPEEHKIGEDLGTPPSLEKFFNEFSPMRLRFYNVESIDVIIDQLQQLKKFPNNNG